MNSKAIDLSDERCIDNSTTGNLFRAFERGQKAHLHRLSRALRDPLLCLGPGFVQGKQTGLSSPLDELVRLCDELRTVNPLWDLTVGGDRVRPFIP